MKVKVTSSENEKDKSKNNNKNKNKDKSYKISENQATEAFKKVRLFFLIINWNGREKIGRCLASLKENLADFNFRMLVVDNHSEDGSCELIQEKFPDVWLLTNPENLGFARAINRGMEYLRERVIDFDYLCLLNNDVVLRDRSFLELIQFMDKNKEVVACLPALLDRKGKPQSGVAGFNLSLTTAFNHFFFFSALFPKIFKGLFINQNYFFRKKITVEVDWLSGAAQVIRQEALDRAGPWPEHFFMYAEDLAYGKNLRRAGKLIYFPGARVYHYQDEKEKGGYQTRWLDSIFAWFILQHFAKKMKFERSGKSSIWLQTNLIILKLIFMVGFFLRYMAYFFWSLASGKGAFRKRAKEMGLYLTYILKTLLKINLENFTEIS